MKQSQYLLFIMTLLLALACNSEDHFILEEPELIDHIDGLVQNRINHTGIQGITINMNNTDYDVFCFSSCNTVIRLFTSTTTDINGEFEFSGFGHPPEGFSRELVVREIPKDYQHLVWINGELSTSFGRPSNDSRWFSLNTEGPSEVLYEFYPRTYFKLHFTNVAPASEDDILEFTVNNAYVYPDSTQQARGFAFVGIHTDAQIGGEVEIENMLTIEYQVTTAGGTESFTKTLECTPGGMTDIQIEY